VWQTPQVDTSINISPASGTGVGKLTSSSGWLFSARLPIFFNTMAFTAADPPAGTNILDVSILRLVKRIATAQVSPNSKHQKTNLKQISMTQIQNSKQTQVSQANHRLGIRLC
jgi:hypothetical protein